MVTLSTHPHASSFILQLPMANPLRRGRFLLALICFSLMAAAPAHAQERWTPDLVICGIDYTNPTAWVWRKPGDPCDSTNPPFVFGDPNVNILIPSPTAPYLNQPADFAEVVKPAVGTTAAVHHLIVADSVNGRVLRFLDTGTSVTYAGELAPGTFVLPTGVHGDVDGNIIVGDIGLGAVLVFAWDGTPIGAPVTQCNGDTTPFAQPWRISSAAGTSASTGAGMFLIVDGMENRVVLCDGRMNFIKHFGTPIDISGANPGYFDAPTSAVLDQAGHIFVADPNNGRVQVFDANANLHLGSQPIWIVSNSAATANNTTVPDMRYPFGVAVDANGRVLVADSDNNAMWVLDSYVEPVETAERAHRHRQRVRVPPAAAGARRANCRDRRAFRSTRTGS